MFYVLNLENNQYLRNFNGFVIRWAIVAPESVSVLAYYYPDSKIEQKLGLNSIGFGV